MGVAAMRRTIDNNDKQQRKSQVNRRSR